MCIFPSDGTNRIRFTGKGYQAHSQPDASGPPKTYCFAIFFYYSGKSKIVNFPFFIFSFFTPCRLLKIRV